MSQFLRHAQEVFATACSAAGEDCDLMLVVERSGAVRAVATPGWSLDALREHHGAAAAYRVSRSGGSVRLEGSTGSRRCVLESGPPPGRTGVRPCAAPSGLLLSA